MLNTLVEQLHTNFSEEAESWQDAVRKCCQPLVESGELSKDYAEDVIRKCEQNGPYILIAPGIAMPQTTTNHKKIRRTAGSFMKLKKPVTFYDHGEEKKADLFFTLAACNHDEHLILAQRLIRIAENKKVMELIRKAESVDDLKKLGEQYCS